MQTIKGAAKLYARNGRPARPGRHRHVAAAGERGDHPRRLAVGRRLPKGREVRPGGLPFHDLCTARLAGTRAVVLQEAARGRAWPGRLGDAVSAHESPTDDLSRV